MSNSNLHEEAGEECPLCMEPFEMDDLNFYPCTCGYQICRFCWHRIRTDENGLCPACRKAYSENPADFKPLSAEELQRIKQEKRAKDLQKKQKVTENRKHLANVRVVQKNLVFVVGLSTRLADAETLKKPEYFGRFGKIYKVVINHSTSYAGSQGPSASAYVTYQRAEDALRAIQAVNNVHIDGRTLKASLGTTKYCSHFMKNQQCPKVDCMYLHELGDEAASFTKEQMQQGKHQEFEKRLQELYLGSSTQNGTSMGILTPEKALCNSSSGSVTPGMSESPELCNSLTIASPIAINKKTNSTGKENNAPNIGSQESFNPSSVARDIWPLLNASSTKESKKSKGKGSNSSRHTPTEEQNNNHKRNSRDRDQKECNGEDLLISEESSSPATVTSTSSSADGSCVSSTSNTPPPIQETNIPPTSPVPVIHDTRPPPSPPQTPSSSFSSCSEPSSSLPSTSSNGGLQPYPQPHMTEPQIVPSKPQVASVFPEDSFFSNLLDMSGFPHPRDLATSHTSSPLHNIDFTNTNGLTSHETDCRSVTNVGFPQVADYRNYTENHSQAWEAAIFDFENNDDLPQNIDDELGFDPFEETNKALAEDIKIEQKQLEEQRHQQSVNNHHSQGHTTNNHLHNSHRTLNTRPEVQLPSLHAGLKSLLQGYPSTSNNLTQTRLPPPGFNGLSGLNHFGAQQQQQQQQQQQLNKLIPSVYGNISSNQQNTINGLPSNRLNMPPGLGGNMLGGTTNNSISNSLVNNMGGVLPNPLIDMESLGMPPPGLAPHKNGDFLIKELENGFRNMLPNTGATSVSTMNTLNTVNTLNSMASNASVNSSSHNNTLANFLNMSHHHQSQQPQTNILSLAQFNNSFPSSQKGWPNNAAPDLTAIDPAIVSSGQLTDSRTDSPPHWLKNMELPNSDALGHNVAVLPFNLVSLGHPNTMAGLQASLPPQQQQQQQHHQPPQQQQQHQQQHQQRSFVWPPTSPPPGFSSISPLHHNKQHQPHKIENL